jgi:hypothetical protein
MARTCDRGFMDGSFAVFTLLNGQSGARQSAER